ncbi:SpaA isopeptide-forming pilin-related protein [Hominenteromicrobium sp.]|uniref:SpaA isopeptide-forming pilin-related protein n=1 Tax=Hominenteromicrobium sp. TaxID=3073581 RepID=UPI003AB2FF79
MKQTFKSRLRRMAASALAAAALFSQPILTESAVYAAEPKATRSPVKVAEQNPFDGLCTSKHSTKISDYNANVMEVEISGEKYLAYCLNPNRYGSDNVSGGAVGSSGYSVQVYDLDAPALQSVPDFQLDQSILLAMQGAIASDGYTGGGDAAAGKLMDPYDASRPLYRDHLQAYAVTKYAMWSLASGWYGPDWKVYSGSSYKPQDNAYLLQSLTNIIGWGTNWKEFNDENLYVNPMDYDSDGDVWTEDPDTGERYVEFQVITGKTGDNRGHVSLGKEYTVTPGSSLPAGFHLEKTDGTRITGSTTLRGAVSSSYGSEDKFRLVAEAGTELSALGKDAVVSSVSTEIEAFALKYGVAIPPAGYSKVQNYALIPENTWKQVSADVKLSVEAPTTSYSFRIQKVDGSTALSGAEFRVESADGSETYDVTTPSSGIVTVNVKKPGTFYVKETKAPSGYSLDSTRYSVNVENGKEVTLTVQNSKDAGLKIYKYDANTDEPLSGAVFTVTNIGTGWSTDVTTGNTGLAILSNLEPGDYRIEEKTPPAGYLPAENPVQTIKLEADTVGQVVYKNEPDWSEVSLRKTVEGTDEPIANVVFEFRRQDSAKTQSFTTDENGEIHARLVPDWYVVRELSGPENVVITPTPRTVQLLPGETVELAYTNKLKPSLTLRKVDDQTDKPLAGAILEVKYSDGSFVGEGNCGRGPGVYRSDENGTVELMNLPDGASVVVRELEAPEGYLLDNTPHTIKLNAGETHSFTLRNAPKPGLYLRKIDSETKEPILGARFEISKPDVPGSAQTYMTNDQGVIFLPEQDVTALVIEEIAAAPGYILNSKPITVQLEPGKRKDIVIENTSKPGLRILKTDEDGNPVDGVTIRVSREDGSVVGEYVTEDGAIFLPNLNAATYVLEEIACPPQYQLNTEKKIVTLEEGKIGQVAFVNMRRPSLEIVKLDSITKSPLAGVTFRISEVNGREIGQFQTDGEGRILVTENLQDGVRYEVQEVATVSGYILDSEPRQITLKAGEDNALYIENTAKSPLYILKTDEKTGEPVGGVKFRVEKANGELIAEVTTSGTGYAAVPQMEPGYVTVREISVPDGYTLDPIPKTILIEAGKPAILHFENEPYGSLSILKTDADGNPLAGAVFELRTADGALVASVTSGENGLAVVPNLKGDFIVTEIKSPEGYLLDSTPHPVHIEAGEPAQITIKNDAVAGLKIVKTVEQTGEPLEGVTFRIEKPDGGLIGEYTTNEQGQIFVSLEPQIVVVREISAPEGYSVDSTPRTVEIKANDITTLTYKDERLNGIRIRKVDADTGRGIYGVRIMVTDENSDVVGVYTTDHQGYIEIDKELPDGVYYLEEIEAAPGYDLDKVVKRIRIENGKTKVIVWENAREKGQIQILKTSADANPVTGQPAGSRLEGAVFEIARADTDRVVGYMVSDYRGVAASEPLPLGKYVMREVTPPAFYQLNPKEFTVELKVQNDIVRVEVQNASVQISPSVKKSGNTVVVPGQQMRYDFSDICNLSNVPLENFYWHDDLPGSVRLTAIHTGTWSQPGLTYSVTYRTNRTSAYRTLASGLLSTQSYDLDCTPSKLGLAADEFITDFRFEFGTVQPGFREQDKPMILVTVNQGLANGHRFANRTDAGGQYNSKWFSSSFTWVTEVYAPVLEYPKTGY